jgi:flagellar biosynthetic protein FlhB
MAGDNKTEEATPRRRRKEREKGNISKSQDLNSAVTITAGCCLMIFLASKILSNTTQLMYQTITHLNPKEIPSDDVIAILVPYAKGTGDILLPFLLCLRLCLLDVRRKTKMRTISRAIILKTAVTFSRV